MAALTAPSDDVLAAVSAALADLAPPGVRTGCRPIVATDVAGLHAIEASAVERAVPARVHEFATGRALLRALLGTDVALPVGTDRAPELPAGFVASLAHTGGLAVAAAAPADVATSLGIDVEPVSPLSDDLARIILRPDEPGLDAHLAFTLKEAVYKAWSGLGGGMLDHHDVRLRVGTGGWFEGTVVAERTVVTGRWLAVADRWLALAAVMADR